MNGKNHYIPWLTKVAFIERWPFYRVTTIYIDRYTVHGKEPAFMFRMWRLNNVVIFVNHIMPLIHTCVHRSIREA